MQKCMTRDTSQYKAYYILGSKVLDLTGGTVVAHLQNKSMAFQHCFVLVEMGWTTSSLPPPFHFTSGFWFYSTCADNKDINLKSQPNHSFTSSLLQCFVTRHIKVLFVATHSMLSNISLLEKKQDLVTDIVGQLLDRVKLVSWNEFPGNIQITIMEHIS